MEIFDIPFIANQAAASTACIVAAVITNRIIKWVSTPIKTSTNVIMKIIIKNLDTIQMACLFGMALSALWGLMEIFIKGKDTPATQSNVVGIVLIALWGCFCLYAANLEFVKLKKINVAES